MSVIKEECFDPSATGALFTLFEASVTFFEARERCTSIGADLARIDSDEQFLFIRDIFVADQNTNFWIGNKLI